MTTRRILVLADFACATGFAKVAENVVAQLLKETRVSYQIDVIGINYFGLPTQWQKIFPAVRIFPALNVAKGDVFGRSGFMEMIATGAYDFAWILQDTFQIEPIGQDLIDLRNKLAEAGKKTFRIVYYFPIDATPKENWIKKTVSLFDAPVVYTEYGKAECLKIDPELKDRLRVIPHGIDTSVFKPLADRKLVEKFRHDYFLGFADDKFLITNVNRNQPRKDIARTLAAFKYVKQQVPEALLYLHMKSNDVAYNVKEVARNYELIPEKDFVVPDNFDEHTGFSEDIVNLIYNSSQAVVSTTLGEGWGLSITEAMATKVPVVAPDHTSIAEILADGRGLLAKAGSNISEWITIQADNERMRPLTNIADMVEKIVYLRNNYKSPEVQGMIEKAYQHVTENWTWDKIGQTWRDLLYDLASSEKVVKVGRNDPCPECLKQGKTVKYKHCKEHFRG